MTGLLVNMAVAIFLIVIGAICTGWLLRHRGRDETPASSVLERLKAMADRLANDVTEHKDCISLLPEVLATADLRETQAIVKIVAGLIHANHHIREQLAGAEVEMQKQAEELSVQGVEARTDGLTRLANRRVFDEELSRRFAECHGSTTPLAVLLIDVDHFKYFNDTYGHRAGDEVLRRLAAVLRKTMREIDLVGRYGGEEFGIILPEATLCEARKAAERVRVAVEQCAIRFEGQEYRITISVGAAQLTSTENIAFFMRRVDQALYHAKRLGRNRSCFHDQGRLHCETGEPCALPPKPALPAESTAEPPRADVPDRGRAGNAKEEPRPLPGLYDRAEFHQYIKRRLAEWKRGGPIFSLAFVEIRGYEPRLPEGEQRRTHDALRIAMAITEASIRDMDFMVRYGGNVLALLLPNMSTANTGAVWRRIRDQVGTNPLFDRDQGASLAMSVGVADAQEGDDYIRLVERATEALETAKSEPGNHCYIHNSRWPERVEYLKETEHPCSPLT